MRAGLPWNRPAAGMSAVKKGAPQAAASEEELGYTKGDRVRHVKFGEGTVTNIASGGRDFEVTVQFDTAGVKKMFASFAKLVKIG